MSRYSLFGNNSQKIFNKDDLMHFKYNQMKNCNLMAREYFDDDTSYVITNNSFEENVENDYKYSKDSSLKDCSSKDLTTQESIEEKVFSGAKISVNNPPISPYSLKLMKIPFSKEN